MLSVLTITYDCQNFIRRCFSTLAGQTNPHWEWVVVNDGSRDFTRQILSGLRDPRIRVIHLPTNRGRGFARAEALKAARGDWVVTWDIDDMYFSDRLAHIREAAAQEYDFFCSYALLVDNGLRVKGVRGFEPAHGVVPRKFVHSTFACRTDWARRVGYDREARAGEDARLMYSLSANGRGKFHHDTLTIYQEDREVHLRKSTESSRNRLQEVRRLYREKMLPGSRREYAATVAKWNVKLACLHAMRLFPGAYAWTVPRRSSGEVRTDWELSPARGAFLHELRNTYTSTARAA